jgi:ABC-type nitrate/sulfonate/bicarbonate transport system substrate-binding protein
VAILTNAVYNPAMRILSSAIFLVLGAGFAMSVQAEETSVYFDTGSAKAKPALVKAIQKKAGKGASYHVSGWTDPRGSEEINRRLRTERAESVKRALVALGVTEDQIQLEDGGGSTSTDPKTFAKQRRALVRYDKGAPSVAKVDEPPVKNNEPKNNEPKNNEPKNNEPKNGTTGAQVAAAHPSDQKKLEPLRLIYWKALNHALWIVAKQKGYFEDEGFDVELQETDENAREIRKKVVGVAIGVESTQALQKGQHKFAMGAVCGFATHEAMAHGDPIVDIGSMIMVSDSLVMKKELAAAIDKDTRAFKGTKTGDAFYGTGEHEFKYNNVLRVQLEKAGLKDDDYQIIEYKDLNQEYRDLAAGKIDIAKSFPPSDLEFVRAHPDFVKVPFAKFFPYLPCCRQVVTRAQLKDNRGKYVRLLRASIRAHQFTVQHPKEAAEIIGKWLKISPTLVRQSIMSSYVTLTPDPMRKGVELYQRTNDKFTKTKTSTAEFIDTSLYRDALFGLARENEDPLASGYYTTMISRFRANN